ncbi:MAG: C39 family peptidase [Cyanobium sp.]
MTAISLCEAARWSQGLPHQQQAWSWLQQQLTPEQLAGFAERFRATPAPEPEPPLLTASQCQVVFGRAISPEQLADLNACLQRFEIDTPARIGHFLAQIAHESGGLRWLQELADGRDYEGRRDLGNTQPGDGPRFKGAGAIQLTGRANYERFSVFLGDPGVMEGCGYVAQRYPFTSAGFWWHSNGLNAEVDRGASCRRISRLVNGLDPARGLAEREAFHARACAVVGAALPAAGLGTAATGDHGMEPDPAAASVAAPVASPSAATTTPRSRVLTVPYFSQLDSSTDQGARMCFSSSCAMLVATLKPEALPGGDDAYLAIVNRYGDTTSAEAQIQALASLGITARFESRADFSQIERQIDRGVPVPCGFIHKGPVEAPHGGGHWLCVVGYDERGLIVHDPNGDLDLIAGVYGHRHGRSLHYSRRNFGRRWMVDGSRANAYAPGHGWAVIAEPVVA